MLPLRALVLFVLSTGALAAAAPSVPGQPGEASVADLGRLWPQWRGPRRDCTFQGPTWPVSLQGKGLEQLWRVELAESYSGPIVAADRIFVTETQNRSDEVVRALDRRTGKELWRQSWKGSISVPFFARSNGSWIRATPAYDGQYLYVAGIRDVLVCLSAATGAERWRADLKERHGTPLPSFGFVCSPLVDGEGVYVQAAASLVKLDRRTGKTVWRTLQDGGGMFGSAFSSPCLATLRGIRQLVVQTRTTLAGVALDTGAVLWKQDIPAFRGMNILTPTIYGDSIFTSAYGAKTYRFDITRDGDRLRVQTAWSLPMDANMSSPLVVGHHAYLHLRNQRFCCIDLETGKTTWTTTRAFGKYVSMVRQGDRVLALDQRGILLLIRANPEKFELLDERKIANQETWAHLALVDDEVHIRELKAMAVYRWRQPADAAR